MPHHNEQPSWITVFLERQRIPPGSRLSAWLHGESVVRHHGHGRSNQNQHKVRAERPVALETARSHLEDNPSGMQPQLRFLQSPINLSQPRTPSDCYHTKDAYEHPAFGSPILIERPRKTRAIAAGHRKKRQRDLKASRHKFFHSKDPRIQCIGTLVSGTLLTIVLATCNTF